MEKFSKEELEYFTNGDPLYPDDKDIITSLYAKKEEYLRSIGATDKDIEEGDDLCPEEFWWHACDIVAALAQELLDERERKYDHWIEFVKSIEGEVKTLKKELNIK
jgi:hypothetical protein